MSGASDVAEIAVVCGPTAAGKSAVAMWLSARAPVTIISADSRQVYRHFDVGTAKPSAGERAAVPHRGIDLVEPTMRYSAAAWADAAHEWIDDAIRAGRIPLVVGGTGLYLRALFDGLFEEPLLDPDRRARLLCAIDAMPTGELRRWVMDLDPPRAGLGRTQLIRAIEIALLTGRRLSELHRERPREPRWHPRYLLVDPGPALAGRIAARIDDMLEHGWPEEVRRLMETVADDAPAWNAAGYGAVRSLVADASDRAAVVEQILIETRQYAKRQRTWFRNQLSGERVTRIDPLDAGWQSSAASWFEAFVRQAGGI